ncbi:MAG: RNA polymerase sigma factor [Planctomycetota bacterium]
MVESQLEILRVQRILQTIPEIDRAAFVLRVQHELPCAEIARILGFIRCFGYAVTNLFPN